MTTRRTRAAAAAAPQARPDPAPIVLPPRLDSLAAADLKPELALRLTDGVLRLDGAEVERASTAAIQLLLAADRSLRARGGRLRLERPAPALVQALAALGLAEIAAAWMEERA